MNIAVIGAGNMGSAIARAIARSGNPDFRVTVSNPTQGKLDALLREYPDITVTTDNVAAAAGADIIVLAIKPWILPAVVEEIKPRLVYRRHVIVSIAGGVGLDDLERFLHRGDELPSLFYVIPDTAISVGHGMTFIASRRAEETTLKTVVGLFASMGEVAVVEERLMGAATALNSCGIAYVFKYMQACVQAGVQLGFRPADALRYVVATVDGAAALLKADPVSPQEQIDRVTTPGGMTIKGINALEHNGFTSAVIKGILEPLK